MWIFINNSIVTFTKTGGPTPRADDNLGSSVGSEAGRRKTVVLTVHQNSGPSDHRSQHLKESSMRRGCVGPHALQIPTSQSCLRGLTVWFKLCDLRVCQAVILLNKSNICNI